MPLPDRREIHDCPNGEGIIRAQPDGELANAGPRRHAQGIRQVFTDFRLAEFEADAPAAPIRALQRFQDRQHVTDTGSVLTRVLTLPKDVSGRPELCGGGAGTAAWCMGFSGAQETAPTRMARDKAHGARPQKDDRINMRSLLSSGSAPLLLPTTGAPPI